MDTVSREREKRLTFEVNSFLDTNCSNFWNTQIVKRNGDIAGQFAIRADENCNHFELPGDDGNGHLGARYAQGNRMERLAHRQLQRSHAGWMKTVTVSCK
jgi:hypothetical protein